jgi:hypothetical protein
MVNTVFSEKDVLPAGTINVAESIEKLVKEVTFLFEMSSRLAIKKANDPSLQEGCDLLGKTLAKIHTVAATEFPAGTLSYRY